MNCLCIYIYMSYTFVIGCHFLAENLKYDMLVMFYNANCTHTHMHVKQIYTLHILPWLVVYLLVFCLSCLVVICRFV